MMRRRDRPSVFSIVWTLIKIGTVLGLCFMATAAVYTFHTITSELPDEKSLENYTPSEPTRIYSSDNVVLAVVSATEHREFVPITEIPQNLRNATVAVEDSSFYSHSGMSLRGTFRALLDDITRHSKSQGGSTITQQLARNLENSEGRSYTGFQKSLSRKISEALLAMQIERHFSKDEILQLYLNQVYYGSQAYGVQAAAETYFALPVNKLNLAECALIAGLPQRPTVYDPYKNLSLAVRRRNVVLARMRQLGYIDGTQEAASRQEVPVLRKQAISYGRNKAPHFVDYVLRQLTKIYGDELVHRGGLSVYTTLDYRMQKSAESTVNSSVLNARHMGENVHQMALVCIDQHNGYIKAMVGGAGDYQHNQYNRAIHARQPGSSFKLFDYTAALEDGMGPDDGISDALVSYPWGRYKWWTPRNFDAKYFGWVTLRQALAHSENTVAVKVADRVGIRKVIAVAERMGVHSDPFCEHRRLTPYLPTAIGASEVAPVEMCTAYATSADGGIFHQPTAIVRVKDHNGSTLFDYGGPRGVQVVPKEITDEMNSMLRSVVQAGTGKNADRPDLFSAVYGKTGTTQDDRDAWFIGFTPELTTAIWAGNDRYRNAMLGVHGGTLCAGAWVQYMKTAVPLMQPAAGPASVPAEAQPDKEAKHKILAESPHKVRLKICTESGMLARPDCPHTRIRSFDEADRPTERCTMEHAAEATEIYICPESGKIATRWCPNAELKSFPAGKIPTKYCDIHRG